MLAVVHAARRYSRLAGVLIAAYYDRVFLIRTVAPLVDPNKRGDETSAIFDQVFHFISEAVQDSD